MELVKLNQYVQASQLISKFYYGLDNNNKASISECLYEDTSWHRKTETLKGVDSILAAIDARDKTRVTAHQASNLIVSEIAADKVSVSYYLNVYDNQGNTSSGLQLKVILRMTDILINKNDCWYLHEKRSATHIRSL